jgi:hypothetical protein
MGYCGNCRNSDFLVLELQRDSRIYMGQTMLSEEKSVLAPTAWNILVPFALCVLCEIVFIQSFDPFPTVDMPFHIAAASGMVDLLHSPSYPESKLLRWTMVPAPNLLPQLGLAALTSVTKPEIAEKLLLTGYIALLSFACFWALLAIRDSRALLLSFFILPLTFNISFLWGFLNFSYSIAGFLLVAGLLIRWRGQWNFTRAAAIALALVGVYFTHLVGFLEAALLTCCFLMLAIINDKRKWRVLAISAATLLPSAVLLATFFVLTRSAPSGSGSALDIPWLQDELRRIVGVLTLRVGVASYDKTEMIPVILFAGMIWGLVAYVMYRNNKNRQRSLVPTALLLFVVIAISVALFAPDGLSSGGSLGVQRYSLFPFLAATLWLGFQSLSRRLLMGAGLIAALCAFALLAIRHDNLRDIEMAISDLRYLEPCVAKGSTIVQANLIVPQFGTLGRGNPDPLSAEASRLAAASGVTDVGNIDWAVPFGLLGFKPNATPVGNLVLEVSNASAGWPVSPRFHYDHYEQSAGVAVDFVAVLGRVLPKGAIDKQARYKSVEQIASERDAFNAELSRNFTLAMKSPLGYWELWRRNGLDAACEKPTFAWRQDR